MTSFGKGLDGFCPMGPWIATAEEVGEPWALDLRCWVNGEEVQHGNTRDLIFPVATLIAWLSRFVTLQPGDVIATGTPAGVGHFRTPPVYLKPGRPAAAGGRESRRARTCPWEAPHDRPHARAAAGAGRHRRRTAARARHGLPEPAGADRRGARPRRQCRPECAAGRGAALGADRPAIRGGEPAERRRHRGLRDGRRHATRWLHAAGRRARLAHAECRPVWRAAAGASADRRRPCDDLQPFGHRRRGAAQSSA